MHFFASQLQDYPPHVRSDVALFFFFSPSLPLPTMLFLFLSGSSYKHLLCESDKPYPKPQRELQPKATNRGRPWESAQAGSHQAGIEFHMFWLKLVKLKHDTSPGYQALQSKLLRQKKTTFLFSWISLPSPPPEQKKKSVLIYLL